MGLFRSAKPNLASVKNYVPGKPLEELQREYGVKKAIKVASNENALGASPKALAAIRKKLPLVFRYPEGGCHYLRQKLAKMLGVQPEQLVFGNGSDELLVMAARAFVGAGDEVITADPTFLIYEIASSVENGVVKKVPMKNFRYDLEGMLAHIESRTKIIFIANPDNPVGTYIPAARLVSFLTKVPMNVLVVLDEAYYEFARVKKDYPDSSKLLKEFKNLIVTRTFSKAYGLAGLRVGYAVTTPDIARTLEKVREPFNVNSLAQAAALAALDDKKFLKRSVRVVNEGREYLTETLEGLGFKTVDTVTNFILFDLKREAAPIYEKLLRAGVIVRPMGGWGLSTFLRVTIGKKADNHRFIKALQKALGVALFALTLAAPAMADVITHKNGQVLEGTITSESDQEITIDVDGMSIPVQRSDIASLVRKPIETKKAAVPANAPTAEAVEAQAAAPPQKPVSLSDLEKPLLVFDERKWKLGYQDAKQNQVIAEFVLENETVENWTELVTAQLFIGLRSEPRYFAEYVKKKTKDTCPSTVWKTISEQPEDILYEWSVSGCKDIPDQSEIARTHLGRDGLHVIHYAIKLGEMPEDKRQVWTKNLETTQFA